MKGGEILRRSGRSRGRWISSVCLLLGLLLGAAIAQGRDFSKVEIRSTDLGSGIALLQGAGGNLGLSVGVDGVFLIDDDFAPLSERIRAAIRARSPEPIRFVLNTHWHGDHTGGNAKLGQAGALIFAHRLVRERLSQDQILGESKRAVPAAAPAAWPVVTFEEGVTLYLNDQTIEIMHVAPAHTDGDSIVRFKEANVMHLGDTFFSGIYPFIDVTTGGRIDGMIDALDRALTMMDDKTQVIPGHGPLSTKADVAASRAMLQRVRDEVAALMAKGLDREAILAAGPSARFDAEFGGGFMKPDRFVGIVYDSLKADRR